MFICNSTSIPRAIVAVTPKIDRKVFAGKKWPAVCCEITHTTSNQAVTPIYALPAER